MPHSQHFASNSGIRITSTHVRLVRLSVLCSAMITLLTGCAWANRNSYTEPSSGDLGTISFINLTADQRSHAWIYYNQQPDSSGKAIAAFDAEPVRTVRALHAPSLVLGLALTSVHYEGPDWVSSSCQGNYQLPFTKGDLRVFMMPTKQGCQFAFESSLANDHWVTATGVQRWTSEIPTR